MGDGLLEERVLCLLDGEDSTLKKIPGYYYPVATRR